MTPSTFAFYWLVSAGTLIGIYYLSVTGRLFCAFLFLGHAWEMLKEEVARPVKVIKDALSRKGLELDEHEEHLS